VDVGSIRLTPRVDGKLRRCPKWKLRGIEARFAQYLSDYYGVDVSTGIREWDRSEGARWVSRWEGTDDYARDKTFQRRVFAEFFAPLPLYWAPDGGKQYLLLDVDAALVLDLAMKLGVDLVPAYVSEKIPRQALVPSPIDLARGYKELLDSLGSIEKVAGHVGKSKSWVREHLDFLELPEAVQEGLHQHRITKVVARRIIRQSDPLAKRILAEIIGG